MPQLSLFGPPVRIVVFDLETRRGFDEVGGRHQLGRLGLSIGVLYDYNAAQYLTFTEETVSALVDELLSSTLVVGFNVKGFDYAVLAGYRRDVNFSKIPTLDIMEKVQETLGFRVSLDSIASATLGRGKSASGLDALRWFKEGRFDLIEKYCRDDVEITRLVYEYARDHGHLKFTDRTGSVREFPVSLKTSS